MRFNLQRTSIRLLNSYRTVFDRASAPVASPMSRARDIGNRSLRKNRLGNSPAFVSVATVGFRGTDPKTTKFDV